MNNWLRFGRQPSEQQAFQINRSRSKWPWFVAGLAVLLIIVGGAIMYYANALAPVDTSSQEGIRIVVTEGETATDIADTLFTHGLIRNKAVFGLYTQLTNSKSKLRAGGYLLKKSQSVADIVDHLAAGKSDEMMVTILPGMTLKQLADPHTQGSLAQQGFTTEEITAAFGKSYSSPLFKDKPVGSDLEGYIYPETYKISVTDTLDTVLELSFKEFYDAIEKNNVVAQLASHKLNLYQGITLASIVQKEASRAEDQPQIAQVFLKRLDTDTVLGSDVTFLYIAHKEGRTPSVSDPSPYNTRIHGGLPPGPIANFNLSALKAVINPAPGDYLYFVAGDDGTIHYAVNEADHDLNVSKYCKALCSQ